MALVCLCHGVSDREVRAAVAGGADCVERVGDQCRAGTSCESCHDTLEALIDGHPVARRGVLA